MFKTKFQSLSTKITFTVSIVLLIAFAGILSFYNISLKKRINYESEQILLNIAMQYETKLNSEIEKNLIASDILSVNISKNIDNNNLKNQISEIFKNFINKNNNIYNISLIINKTIDISDSLPMIKSLKDSVSFYKLSFSRKGMGIVKDKDIEINSIENQLLIAKAIDKNVSNVLNAEFINDKLILIPIIQPIFKGNRYIGYIRIFIDTSWLYSEKYKFYEILEKDIEIDITSENGKIFFANKRKYLLGKNLKSEFIECGVKSNSKSFKNKTIFKNNKLTLCKAININNTKWSIRLSINKNKLSEIFGYNFYIYLIIGLIIIIITIIIIVYFLNKTIKPLKMLISFAKKVSIGDFKCEDDDQNKNEIKRKDEIGELQKAFKEISASLLEITDVSESIAEGNFNKNIKIRSEGDILAKSINKMNQALIKAKEEEKQRIKDSDYSKWFTEGINEINKVLKIHHKDIFELTKNVTQSIVKFFNIALGGIFITKEDENKEIYLELISAYAYSDSKFIKKKFKVGESLVGACASEKRMVNLKKLPKGYLQVLSGLGEASPKHLLILPLLYENELMGVLELASLTTISDNEIKLLESISENIASNLSIAKANLNTQELLDKSQQYAKELAEKDNKMNAAMQQLQELQETTAQSEASIKAKLNAMNNTLMTVEYTIDGELLDANQKYLNTMNYSFDEIKGINVLELLKDEDKAELQKVIEIVKKGNFYESIMRRPTKEGREKWILATYTPIKNKEGGVEKILFYGVDITRVKEKEAIVKEELEKLKNKL